MTTPSVRSMPAKVEFVNAPSNAAVYPERSIVEISLQNHKSPISLPGGNKVKIRLFTGEDMLISAWALLEGDIVTHIF